MTSLRDLMDEAARLGAQVQLAHFDDPNLLGLCDQRTGVITIAIDMSMRQIKETLAHELGHRRHGDECSTPSAERRADRYASRLLIDAAAYRDAELVDPDPAAIAEALGVTRRMVTVFQREWLPTLSLSRRLRTG